MALTSNELIEKFDSEMKASESFKHIDDKKNPCHIMFEGVEYYVYVKNISSAYFSNPDVSRAQMTGVDALAKIKESNALFILLGYDSENDVYAAWNPHVAKQRIGTAASPSLYSRFSWQKEAAEQGDFITRELKNDGSVLLFPSLYISIFMANIEMFFPDTTKYVAMGSKRRSGANAAYRELVNTSHLDEFARFLAQKSYDENAVKTYVLAIRQLISESIISSNRRIFLACDTIEEYKDAVQKFLALDEIKDRDANNENVYSHAMSVYVEFLIEKYGETLESDSTEEDPDDFTEEDADEIIEDAEEDTQQDIDYETPFIDDKGNLTVIANPVLIGMLREDLDSEYPRQMAAYATIEDFYGNRFPNMEMCQWQALFNKINWSNPYTSLAETPVSEVRKRSARQKIQVTFPDGKIVCENQVVKTLLAVINYAGVDKVYELGITMGKNAGGPLIDDTVNQKYANAFKPLEGGLYANTCSDTPTKLSQIKQIDEALNLGLKIEII